MTKAKLQTLMTEDWVEALYPYFQTDSFKKLSNQIASDRKITEVYPKKENIFRVFKETALKDVKVVLLGDSPSNMTLWDGTPVSNGRAYGSDKLIVIPKETKQLHEELGEPLGFDYSLQHLVDQGVLLLNMKLTSTKNGNVHVEWYDFIKVVFKVLNKRGNLDIIFKNVDSDYLKSLFDNPTIVVEKYISNISYINWKDSTPLSLIDKMRTYTRRYHENAAKMINFIPQEEIEIIPPKTNENE